MVSEGAEYHLIYHFRSELQMSSDLLEVVEEGLVNEYYEQE